MKSSTLSLVSMISLVAAIVLGVSSFTMILAGRSMIVAGIVGVLALGLFLTWLHANDRADALHKDEQAHEDSMEEMSDFDEMESPPEEPQVLNHNLNEAHSGREALKGGND